MRLRLAAVSIFGFLVLGSLMAPGYSAQSAPMTNTDVIELKKAGVGDEIVIARIRFGATKFNMETSDIVALKSAGVSDAVIAEMLKPAATGIGSATSTTAASIDLSKGAVIKPFGTSVDHPDSAGLPQAMRESVVDALRLSKMFSGVAVTEQAGGQKGLIEISAELVSFAPGNTAARLLIGFGAGRANSSFNFVVTESATGKLLWKKTIKETSSFWMSGSSSSSSQRNELPDKIA